MWGLVEASGRRRSRALSSIKSCLPFAMQVSFLVLQMAGGFDVQALENSICVVYVRGSA